MEMTRDILWKTAWLNHFKKCSLNERQNIQYELFVRKFIFDSLKKRDLFNKPASLKYVLQARLAVILSALGVDLAQKIANTWPEEKLRPGETKDILAKKFTAYHLLLATKTAKRIEKIKREGEAEITLQAAELAGLGLDLGLVMSCANGEITIAELLNKQPDIIVDPQ